MSEAPLAMARKSPLGENPQSPEYLMVLEKFIYNKR